MYSCNGKRMETSELEATTSVPIRTLELADDPNEYSGALGAEEHKVVLEAEKETTGNFLSDSLTLCVTLCGAEPGPHSGLQRGGAQGGARGGKGDEGRRLQPELVRRQAAGRDQQPHPAVQVGRAGGVARAAARMLAPRQHPRALRRHPRGLHR
eukprot:1193744-Prorocentrum_minimum.AAC.1